LPHEGKTKALKFQMSVRHRRWGGREVEGERINTKSKKISERTARKRNG
jgi:hypothetical protein